MKKSEFRTPLIQSAMLLGGVVILFAAVGSSGATSTGGGILALLAGIGNTILFAIGLSLGIGVCIAVLVGIFLGAVAMVSPGPSSTIVLVFSAEPISFFVICLQYFSNTLLE